MTHEEKKLTEKEPDQTTRGREGPREGEERQEKNEGSQKASPWPSGSA